MGGECSTYGDRKGVYRVVVGKAEIKRPLGRPGVDGRIILRWIFRKWDMEVWTGSGYGQVACTFECGNEPSGSIKCGGIS